MRRPSLLIIFLTVFIDLIGFGIVLPLLPRYSERFGASGITIGVIIASFSLMQFLFAPAWGRLSDRIGRRPVLLISNFGSTVSYGLFGLSAWPAFSPEVAIAVLLASRVFAGACGANLSVASAYIADITTPENRSKGMALIGVAFGLGFILGPAIGAFSARHLGLAGPGWVAAGFCGTNFLLAIFILAESRHPGGGHPVERPAFSQWGHLLRQPKVGLLVALYSLATFVFACYESTLPLLLGSSILHADDIAAPRALAARLTRGTDPISSFLRLQFPPSFLLEAAQTNQSETTLRRLVCRELNRQLASTNFLDPRLLASIKMSPETRRLAEDKPRGDEVKRLNRLVLEDAYPGWIRHQTVYYDERRIGYLFAYCGLVSVLIQGGVIGRLVKRFGEKRVIVSSLVIIAVSLFIIPEVHELAGLLLALGLFSLGTGINRAPTMGLLSMYARPEEQGATMGLAQSASTLARVVGPILATTLYSASPHSPYFFAGLVAVGTTVIAWRYLFKEGTEPRPQAAGSESAAKKAGLEP